MPRQIRINKPSRRWLLFRAVSVRIMILLSEGWSVFCQNLLLNQQKTVILKIYPINNIIISY